MKQIKLCEGGICSFESINLPTAYRWPNFFYQTVHSVNAKDYTKEQRDAWATGEVDLQAWDKSFRAHKTICGTGLQIDKTEDD